MDTAEEYQHDPEEPEAETIVLRRVGETPELAGVLPVAAAEYARVRALIVGQVISTGDRFGDFEVIEIVPPDEPAFVNDGTTIEIA